MDSTMAQARVDDGAATVDRDGDRRAALLAEYEPNARALAHRFYRHGEPLEDLVQVALEALLVAIDRFDPSRGTPFLAFATPTIVGSLKRHYRDLGWSVRVPRRVHDLAGPIGHARAMLEQDLARTPTNAEIADLLDIDAAAVDDVERTVWSRATTSVDADEELGRSLGVADRSIEQLAEHQTLRDALRSLGPDEQYVIVRYFQDGHTQREIGSELGRSQMHVSRMLTRAVDRLRAEVA